MPTAKRLQDSATHDTLRNNMTCLAHIALFLLQDRNELLDLAKEFQCHTDLPARMPSCLPTVVILQQALLPEKFDQIQRTVTAAALGRNLVAHVQIGRASCRER